MNSRTREYIYFVLGLLGAAWFFVGYPSQDPRSLIDISKVDAETIEKKAINKLESLGYNSSGFNLNNGFYSNRILLDSLQNKMGRDRVISRLKRNGQKDVVLFYWKVNFRPVDEEERQIIIGAGDQSSEESGFDESIRMRFNQSGDFLELRAPDDVIHPNVVNRAAIASTFGTSQDSINTILSSYSDTVLTRSLLLDLQQNWERPSQQEQRVNKLKEALQSKVPYRFSVQEVFDMASYYLQQTGWDMTEFVQDTVRLGRVDGTNTTTASFIATNPELRKNLSLDVRLTSTGALLSLTSNYDLRISDKQANGLWSVIQDSLILLFILGGVILFFFRIRARAVDAKPALVVSILSGLAISVLMVLLLISKAEFFTSSDGWTHVIELLVVSGLSGAGGSLAFFMFFAIGDSITRQHWPQKLSIYDYLRQGMIFNKPIGFMLVRSVTWAFILAGIWTLMLWLWPQLYFDIRNEIFLSQQAVLPSLFLVLSKSMFSLSIVLGIFLVLGGQVLAQTKNKLITSIFIVFACGIVVPYNGGLGPSLYQFAAGIILGSAMLYIYLQWDFLTLFLSHFLFLGLLATTTGWIIAGSMDVSLFVGMLIFMTIILVGGFVAIKRGKEEKVLSRYVPEYVEELAQEERIKQELEIAREVQQSFLPVQTPQFKGLELAAICKPAYETGGDYYDFVPLDENRIAVAIGDVSGKGIQAAFFMTFVKGILHSLCREVDSPAEILNKTNRLFCENAPRGTFISLVYGIIDLKKKTFHFSRAGHNPILRITSENGQVEELQPKGIGIGLTKNESFEKHIQEIELSLSKDDLLVLYTDGIVEALNDRGTFYGTQRLNNLLKRNNWRSAEEILKLVSGDIRSFIGDAKQHDDMTMMVMKLKDTIEK